MLTPTEISSSPQSSGYQTRHPLSILQVFTFYENYLENFYKAKPHLISAPYEQQIGALYRDGFGVFHIFAPYLQTIGHNAQFVIANAEILQKQWAKEHDISYREESWKNDILRAQVEFFQPEVFYTLNPLDFESGFIRSLPFRPPLIVGWRAAEIPAGIDWSEFDLIVSHLTVCREKALLHGARNVEFFYPAVPAFISEATASQAKEFDVVFCGQWTHHHGKRNELISFLAAAADECGFSLGLFLASHHFELPPAVKRHKQDARWGMNMYRALKSGRIVINAEIDLAMGEAGNLRLFETTAAGSCLLTEDHKNLPQYFERDREVLTFTSEQEMLEKILYYLKHDSLREEVAQRGQRKVLTEHSIERGVERLDAILVDAWERKYGRSNTLHGESAMDRVHAIIDEALEALRNSDGPRALELVDKARAEDVVVRDLEHVRALGFIACDRLSDAKSALHIEIERFPDNRDAERLLADVSKELIARQEVPPSAPLSSDPNVIAQEAITALKTGKNGEALSLAEQLKRLVPDAGGVNFLLSLCLTANDMTQEAFEAAERELFIDPRHQGARGEYERLADVLGLRTAPKPHPEQRSFTQTLSPELLDSLTAGTATYGGKRHGLNPLDRACLEALCEEEKPAQIYVIGNPEEGFVTLVRDTLNRAQSDGAVTVIAPDMIGRVKDRDDRGTVFILHGSLSTPQGLNGLEEISHVIRSGEIVVWNGITEEAYRDFLSRHPGEFDIATEFADRFGYNATQFPNGYLRKRRYTVNSTIAKGAIQEFLVDDPAHGIDSQMSVNERFQLHYLLRNFLSPQQAKIGFIEIGSHAGASLKLEHIALRRFGRPLVGIAVEPGGAESFYRFIQEVAPSITHLRSFSHDAAAPAAATLRSEGILADFILIDGDHSYEGVKRDIEDYYPLVAPGGIIAFHDFLPELSPENQRAIFFHHGGQEPGIRRACIEVMEGRFGEEVITLPLLYPDDPAQTQPHLPIIPGVFSTIRAYRKRG